MFFSFFNSNNYLEPVSSLQSPVSSLQSPVSNYHNNTHTPSNISPLTEMSDDHFEHVLSFLDIPDMFRLRRTSKDLFKKITNMLNEEKIKFNFFLEAENPPQERTVTYKKIQEMIQFRQESLRKIAEIEPNVIAKGIENTTIESVSRWLGMPLGCLSSFLIARSLMRGEPPTPFDTEPYGVILMSVCFGFPIGVSAAAFIKIMLYICAIPFDTQQRETEAEAMKEEVRESTPQWSGIPSLRSDHP